MRIGWITDIHLNFVRSAGRSAFYSTLSQEKLDALLLGGDIGEARSVNHYLTEMAEALAIPIYFVLGNHDFYGGSIAGVRDHVARQAAASQWLHWLPKSGIVPLTAGIALVGHDSWDLWPRSSTRRSGRPPIERPGRQVHWLYRQPREMEGSMNIELKPEQEQVIAQAIRQGVIHDTGEAMDMLLEILRDRLSRRSEPLIRPPAGRNLVEVCAMVRGLTDDLDFSREPTTDRPVDLS